MIQSPELLGLTKRVAKRILRDESSTELARFEQVWDHVMERARLRGSVRIQLGPHFFEHPVFEHLIAPIVVVVAGALVPLIAKVWRQWRDDDTGTKETEEHIQTGRAYIKATEELTAELKAVVPQERTEKLVRLTLTTTLELLREEEQRNETGSSRD